MRAPLLAALLLACTGTTEDDTPDTDDPPAGAPVADVSPASLTLGPVCPGLATRSDLTVSNAGTADLTLTAFLEADPELQVTPSLTVPAGETQPLSVRCAPTTAGTPTGRLTLQTNDPANELVVVRLSCQARESACDDSGL